MTSEQRDNFGGRVFWFGLALFVLAGGEIGAIVDGFSQFGDGPASGVVEVVVGANVLPWTLLLGGLILWGGHRKRLGLGPLGPTEAAAARIETSQATGSGPDFPVRLDLTVAPEGRPAFRVEATATVNLMNLERYQPGRHVVVDYNPQQPWQVTVRADPGAEWVERITLADLPTAPEETRQKRPKTPAQRRTKWYALLAIVAGVPLWWVAF